MENVFKKIVSALLSIIIILALITGLSYVAFDMFGGLFSIGATEVVPLENGIIGMTNGGLTPAEREQFRNDDELPLGNDVFRKFYITETENYVNIARKTQDVLGESIQPNVTFVKTHQGLIWDGAWGVTATINRNWWSAWADWDNVFMNAGNNPNVKVLLDKNLANYNIGYNIFGSIITENIVTFSDFKPTFVTDFYNINPVLQLGRLIAGSDYSDILLLYDRIHDYLMKFVLIKWFEDISFGSVNDNDYIVEFGMQACADHQDADFDVRKDCLDCMKSTLQSFNSFATYLWQETKTADKSALNLQYVDISHYYDSYIPDDQQINYPIPAGKQAEYNGREYYPIYNCKIIADCDYRYLADVKIDRNQDNIESNIRDREIDPLPASTIDYSKLVVNFLNSNDSDLTNFDIVAEPVTIIFKNDEIGFKGSIVCNSIDDLLENRNYYGRTDCSIAVPRNEIIYYQIYSNGLVFDSYSGSITVPVNSKYLNLHYTYQHGFVGIQVSIAQISSVPSGSIDLATFPVRIILTGNNDEGTYQFVFNDNSLLESSLSMNVKIGSYTYSVLSQQLIFASTTGNIEITATNRIFIFHYSVDEYLYDLQFSIDVSTTPGSGNDINIYALPATVSLLSSKLNDNAYTVKVKIFDAEGYLLLNLHHGHTAGASTCDFGWASNGALTAGVQYTGQLLYMSNTDPLLSYVSGTFNFTYTINTKFKFTYSAVEVE